MSNWRDAGGSVQVADFQALPWADATFDAVLDVAAVCYSPFAQARAHYGELARVARPGARLFVRTFAAGCWGIVRVSAWTKVSGSVTRGPLAGHGATRFTSLEDLPGLLNGWAIDRVQLHSMGEPDGERTLRQWVVHATRKATSP